MSDPKVEVERILMLDLQPGDRLRPPPMMAKWGEVEFLGYTVDAQNEWARIKLDNGIIYGVNWLNLLNFQRTKNFHKVYGKKEQKQPRLVANTSAFLPFWFGDDSPNATF